MPHLIIKNVLGLQWKAIISNSEIEYVFKGTDVTIQRTAVQALSQLMKAGRMPTRANLANVLEIPQGDELMVYQRLYATSTELFYEGDLVYTVVAATGTLDSELAVAGQALELAML